MKNSKTGNWADLAYRRMVKAKNQRDYRFRHPERVKERSQLWREKHPNYMKDYARKRLQNDPKLRAKNREKSRKWYAQHKDDPEYKEQLRLIRHKKYWADPGAGRTRASAKNRRYLDRLKADPKRHANYLALARARGQVYRNRMTKAQRELYNARARENYRRRKAKNG